MPNAQEIKQKILSFIQRNGPSLPVPLGREIGYNSIYASAFLSELFAEKKIKLSTLRVGGSPLYFIPGQEPQLSKFSDYLNHKEKEAFNLLKENNFLEDKKQEPAIRVALREIKDFAFPFHNPENEEIIWRYYMIPESEYSVQKETTKLEEIKVIPDLDKSSEESEKIEIIKEETIKPEDQISEKPLQIFDRKQKVKKRQLIKIPKKKSSPQNNDKFFNSVKETLNEEGYDISDIISFNKNELTLSVKKDRKEYLIIAFNKKISEKEIIKAHKKSSEHSLPFIVLSKSEPSKKIQELIEAVKNLSKIEKIK